jgi:hypothetical protein
MATSIRLIPSLFGGMIFVLTACQPQLFLPLYEAADNSKLPPLRVYPGFEPISFCQLPAFTQQLVYVRGLYTSGNRESSDFQPLEARSPTGQPCIDAIELTFPSADQLPPPMKAKFLAIHQDEDYRTQYLVVDAIGQYEQDKPGGYGHLGGHKGQFVVRELVQVTHVVVKKRKGRRILLIN